MQSAYTAWVLHGTPKWNLGEHLKCITRVEDLNIARSRMIVATQLDETQMTEEEEVERSLESLESFLSVDQPQPNIPVSIKRAGKKCCKG